MKWLLVVLLSLVGLTFSLELQGSKVYTVRPVGEKQFEVLGRLENHLAGVEFWLRPHVGGQDGTVFVTEASLYEFENVLMSEDIEFDVFVEDVELFLDNEMEVQNLAREKNIRENGGRISFTNYNRYAEINEYLDGLNSLPNVTVESLGKSVEGREIKVIRLSTSSLADPRKPIVVVDAGIHAAEWIGPSVALYMIHKLVEDITEKDLVENIDWYIIPLLNPDGYEYSHANSSVRTWRKNRSVNANSTCMGVDLNRNFNYRWMELGSSADPCSDNYAGTSALSEPESIYLDFMLRLGRPRIKLYLAIHSFGSIMVYSYIDGSVPPNRNELQLLGDDFIKAVNAESEVDSVKYRAGNGYELLGYKSTGNSMDFAIGNAQIGLAYTLEMPGGGSTGFDLPPSKIRQAVKEAWEGIVVLARYVTRNKTMESY